MHDFAVQPHPLTSKPRPKANNAATVTCCYHIALCVPAFVHVCWMFSSLRPFSSFISSFCVLWDFRSLLLLTSSEMFWQRHG